jgi:hypothetical protein
MVAQRAPCGLPRYRGVLRGLRSLAGGDPGLAGWGGRIRTSAFRVSRNCLERTCHMNRADHGAGLSAALLRKRSGSMTIILNAKFSNPTAPAHLHERCDLICPDLPKSLSGLHFAQVAAPVHVHLPARVFLRRERRAPDTCGLPAFAQPNGQPPGFAVLWRRRLITYQSRCPRRRQFLAHPAVIFHWEGYSTMCVSPSGQSWFARIVQPTRLTMTPSFRMSLARASGPQQRVC